MKLYTNPVPQYFDNEGNVLSGGKVNFYENGSTTTRKNTYNADGGFENANPLTLTDQGRLLPVWGEGLYTVVVTDANDGQIWVRHGVDFESNEGQFSDWIAVKKYSIKEIVRYTDGNYYISEANNNLGNVPADDSASWSQVLFIEYFNPNKPLGYLEDDIVVDGGFIYRSLQNNNEDTPPSAKWANLTFNDSVAGDFTVGGALTVGSFANFSETKTSLRTLTLGSVTSASYILDPDLTISPLPVGWYEVEVQVRFTVSGSTTNGIRIEVVRPDGDSFAPIAKFGVWHFIMGDSIFEYSASTSGIGSGYPTSGDPAVMQFKGMIYNDTTGMVVGWSQGSTVPANATIIHHGYIKVTRLKDL